MALPVTEPADVVVVRPAARLRATIRPPADKSVAHRALLLAAIAQGTSRIEGGSEALDPMSTAACLRALGVRIAEERGPADGRVDWVVESDGWERWSSAADTLPCGNSGTTLRLLAGALSGVSVEATLDGDASLRARPVARIVEPLRRMGARLSAREGDTLPPLTVSGRRPLMAIDYAMPLPSAQVKSAILLAGLAADGVTTVREPTATRDHTERMLRARGVEVSSADGPDGGVSISVEGGGKVQAKDERIPGDISAAAFWLVAGALHPEAELTLQGVGMNPTRRAVVDLLRRMGARIEEQPLEGGSEPRADLRVTSSRLEGIELGPLDVAAAIDEIPVLALAAACARGRTVIRDAGELRRKESDRLTGIADGLSALGARVEVHGDDLTIHGGRDRPGFGLRGGTPRSLDDHRLAMTFAVAGLLGATETTIDGARSAAISYPGFFDDLERVRA
jgi:3-phosphoshikimate 1-carboxyvinyltransferase